MIFQDVNWIRSNSTKLCPSLRKQALEWYRPARMLPCIFQKFYKGFKQRFKKIQVIVQVEQTGANALSINSLASSIGCTVKKELPIINGFATKVNASVMQKLVDHGGVKKIWLDREVKIVLDNASKVVESPELWESNVTGKGVTVAIIDTGIYKHPDLSGRILAFKDFVGSKTSPYDDNGHGTHVAGDVASNGSKSESMYKGPAPEAGLVGIKVLNGQGSGSLSTVIEGISWCVANKDRYNIRVINMSLGSDATQSYSDDPICIAAENAWNSGIVVCVAAGNSGPESSTIDSPGIDPVILTVGAINDNNTVSQTDDTVADFSSRGPTKDNKLKPDVVAPGVNIISLRSPNSSIDRQNKQARVGSSYISLSGTSMATPICAGVVAQILETEPGLTPTEVKDRLMTTAVKLDNVDAFSQGAGIINVKKAINKNK